MQPVKNIIFDLGGVILNLDFAAAEKAFHEIGFEDFKDVFAGGHVTSFIKDYEVGIIDDDQFVKEIRNLTKQQNDDQLAIAAWNAMLVDFPKERVAFIKTLKKKYRLFLFSNTNAIHLRSFRKTFSETFEREIFDELFEKAYYSHEIKLRKPAKEAFDFVVKDAGLDASETLFIDDMLVNVEGAREAGLQAVQVTPGKSMLDLGL
ncbi:MAG: HAD family phosphatase [Chitinophagaceae bacterium]|nr:MAG: HAD family phosphatase [Chitinophagaceae bacterium]